VARHVVRNGDTHPIEAVIPIVEGANCGGARCGGSTAGSGNFTDACGPRPAALTTVIDGVVAVDAG